MSDVLKRAFSRPEFTRDIIGSREEGFFTGGRGTVAEPGAQTALDLGPLAGLLDLPQGPREVDTQMVTTRTPLTVQGTPPALGFLADLMTGFGAGVPAAQAQQEQRRLSVERPFTQAQGTATLESGLLGDMLREQRQNRLFSLQQRQVTQQENRESRLTEQGRFVVDVDPKGRVTIVDRNLLGGASLTGAVRQLGGRQFTLLDANTVTSSLDSQLGANKLTSEERIQIGQGVLDANDAQDVTPLRQTVQNVMNQRSANRRPSLGTVVIQTVDALGNPISKIVPKTPGSEFTAAPTADERNKAASRARLLPAIEGLESLSKRVITEKQSVVQRAKATGRTVEAALANDPDFIVYQDARLALAGNLAVAQQGSRPSDADIKAIWLPLVPDVFRDTVDSAKLKWQLIKLNSGLPTDSGIPEAGRPTHRYDPTTGKIVPIQ